MVRSWVKGHPPRRTLCPYKMHSAPTPTPEFGLKSRKLKSRRVEEFRNSSFDSSTFVGVFMSRSKVYFYTKN
jgi:hypothetical protein